MAREAVVRGAEVKIRRPWVVFVLSIVTFGIYYLVWYYKINRELRDFGRGLHQPNPLDVSPGVALLAVSLGAFLIVPPFVSMWRTFKRIARAQELAGLERRISHVMGFVLFLIALVLLPFEVAYAQHHLNRLWRRELDEGEKTYLGMRGVPAGRSRVTA